VRGKALRASRYRVVLRGEDVVVLRGEDVAGNRSGVRTARYTMR
jgi:hypothetical protein